MADEFITPGEFLLLLTLFGGPVYALAASVAYASLRRAGLTGRGHRGRVAVALGAALAGALPLTVVAWLALGALPSRWMQWLLIGDGPLALLSYIGVPAVAASALCFPLAVWLVRRRARPAV